MNFFVEINAMAMKGEDLLNLDKSKVNYTKLNVGEDSLSQKSMDNGYNEAII